MFDDTTHHHFKETIFDEEPAKNSLFDTKDHIEHHEEELDQSSVDEGIYKEKKEEKTTTPRTVSTESSSEDDKKFSPGTLARRFVKYTTYSFFRLQDSIAILDQTQEARIQVAEIEKANSIAHAQQETVA